MGQRGRQNGGCDGAPPAAVAIVGATGCGKSDVAEALALRTGGEVVACDSVQVYRGFDIGSAKPPPAVRARIRHHMLDVAHWHTPFSAAAWRAGADAACRAVRARGRLPIICGGSGLYLRALRDGLAPVPAADRAAQAALAALEADAPGTLWRRLCAADPALAAQLGPRNPRRLVRAVELAEACDEPPSAIYARHQAGPRAWRLAIFVLARPACAMRARLRARAAAMLAAGLADEVAGHLARGVPADAAPMRAVGYREVVAALQAGADTRALAAPLAAASWRYARRQATWWRREVGCCAWPAGDADRDAAAIAAGLGRNIYPSQAAGLRA